jgi:PEP-CTERM motif
MDVHFVRGGDMRIKTLLVVATLLVFTSWGATAAFAAPNLVNNGSFETGDFTGWNATDGSLELVVSGPFSAYNGAEDGAWYSVWGNIGGDGVISQTISDVAGQHYNFSFWFAAVGDDPSDFHAMWDSNTLYSQSDPNTGGAWTLFSFDVVGTGSDTITFSGRDDPAWMALDNVSVSAVTGTTPEPSSLLLLGSGLLTVGGAIRRKLQANR